MHLKNKYLAIVINRNMGDVCDELRKELLSKGVSDVIVVDSSTDPFLQSKFVTIGALDQNTLEHGYRINRGFNLGLSYALENYDFDWIFCVPVDTEIIELNLTAFEVDSQSFSRIVAYTLPEKNNPYLPLINNKIGLVWNILEGPILLKRELISKYRIGKDVLLFDNENFRSYLSYKELAFRIYSANFAVGIYDGFIVAEKEELLLTYSELMKTESFSLNKQLLISEGQKWLFKKYGIFDRWAFETIIRLLYEEFLKVNPLYNQLQLQWLGKETKIKYTDLVLEYFNLYSMKDYGSLKALFSENIVLKDWDVHVTGKNKVMKAIKIMFDSADKIKISPVSFFVNSDYCYAVQVSILIDTDPKIDVIDVISFNTVGEITEIVAFKNENISL